MLACLFHRDERVEMTNLPPFQFLLILEYQKPSADFANRKSMFKEFIYVMV